MIKDFKCRLCDVAKFSSQGKLMNHLKKAHQQSYENYVIEYFFNNVHPLCGCGCGTKLKFNPNLDGFFAPFAKNHHPRKPHTTEIKRQIRKSYLQTMMSKYGVENPMALKAFRSKINETKLERYGDATYNNLDKGKLTKLERYGDENYHNVSAMIETNLQKYGVIAYTCTDPGKAKIKQTKLERYGNENYNNIELSRATKLDRYGYETEFSSSEWRKKFNGKNSKIEKVVADILGAEHKFIYRGKEYDMRLGTIIIELDGNAYHASRLENLHLIQLANSMNDFVKRNVIIEHNEYDYLKIPISRINRREYITLEYLQSIAYQQDFAVSFFQKIMSKETLTAYLLKKGKDNLKKYEGIFLKFLRTFQPSFPRIETLETLDDVIGKIGTYNLNSIYDGEKTFRNNSSSLGVSYLKSKFHSYWKSSFKGSLSPYDAWLDDEIMQRVIRYRIGINDSGEIFDFSMHQMVRGLSALRYTVSFFKPLLAAAIYDHFLNEHENPTVLDPCAGFGGRMLGFKSRYSNGTYIGVEPNIDTFNELLELSKNFSNVVLFNCKIEDLDESLLNNIDLSFTSIPYYDLETYSNSVEYENYDDWKTVFLGRIKSLPNLVLNIPASMRHEFESECEEYKIVSNTSHFNKSQNDKFEYLLNFKK